MQANVVHTSGKKATFFKLMMRVSFKLAPCERYVLRSMLIDCKMCAAWASLSGSLFSFVVIVVYAAPCPQRQLALCILLQLSYPTTAANVATFLTAGNQLFAQLVRSHKGSVGPAVLGSTESRSEGVWQKARCWLNIMFSLHIARERSGMQAERERRHANTSVSLNGIQC